MSDEQHGHGHGSIINTPKQLIAAILAGFLIPIIGIILLVQLVANDKRAGAGSDAQSPEAIAERLKPIGDVGYTLKEAGAPKQAAAPADAAAPAAQQATAPAAAPAAADTTQVAANAATPQEPSVAAAAAGAAAAASDAASSAATAANAAAATVNVSADAGKKLYESACLACHSAGLAGAPKVGDKGAWAPRIAKGKDTLYQNAIKGIGVMPAKGGAQASDDEVKAAVDYMITASQ